MLSATLKLRAHKEFWETAEQALRSIRAKKNQADYQAATALKGPAIRQLVASKSKENTHRHNARINAIEILADSFAAMDKMDKINTLNLFFDLLTNPEEPSQIRHQLTTSMMKLYEKNMWGESSQNKTLYAQAANKHYDALVQGLSIDDKDIPLYNRALIHEHMLVSIARAFPLMSEARQGQTLKLLLSPPENLYAKNSMVERAFHEIYKDPQNEKSLHAAMLYSFGHIENDLLEMHKNHLPRTRIEMIQTLGKVFPQVGLYEQSKIRLIFLNAFQGPEGITIPEHIRTGEDQKTLHKIILKTMADHNIFPPSEIAKLTKLSERVGEKFWSDNYKEILGAQKDESRFTQKVSNILGKIWHVVGVGLILISPFFNKKTIRFSSEFSKEKPVAVARKPAANDKLAALNTGRGANIVTENKSIKINFNNEKNHV